MNVPILLRCWNRIGPNHPKHRYWPLRTVKRMVASDVIRDNLRSQPKGKGNKAWRRANLLAQAQRDNPALLLWPDYLFPAKMHR